MIMYFGIRHKRVALLVHTLTLLLDDNVRWTRWTLDGIATRWLSAKSFFAIWRYGKPHMIDFFEAPSAC